MDEVQRKLGPFLTAIKQGMACEEQKSTMSAYACGILDHDGDRYRQAKEHLDDCPSCRLFVLRLRGLAAILPPVALPASLAIKDVGLLAHVNAIVHATWRHKVALIGQHVTVASTGGATGAGAAAGAGHGAGAGFVAYGGSAGAGAGSSVGAGAYLLGGGAGKLIAACAALCAVGGAVIVVSAPPNLPTHRARHQSQTVLNAPSQVAAQPRRSTARPTLPPVKRVRISSGQPPRHTSNLVRRVPIAHPRREPELSRPAASSLSPGTAKRSTEGQTPPHPVLTSTPPANPGPTRSRSSGSSSGNCEFTPEVCP